MSICWWGGGCRYRAAHAKSSRSLHRRNPSTASRGVSRRSGSTGAAGSALGGATFGICAAEVATVPASSKRARALRQNHVQLRALRASCWWPLKGHLRSTAVKRLCGWYRLQPARVSFPPCTSAHLSEWLLESDVRTNQANEQLCRSIRFGGWLLSLRHSHRGSTHRTGCNPSSTDRPETSSCLHIRGGSRSRREGTCLTVAGQSLSPLQTASCNFLSLWGT